MQRKTVLVVELPADAAEALIDKANWKGIDVEDLVVEIVLDYLDDTRVAERVLQRIGDLSDW